MKTAQWLSLSALIGALSFGTPGDAVAAPKLGKAGKTPVLTAVPALRCTIQAFEDEAGMKPIANNAHLLYAGGGPKAWVRLIVENTGTVEATGIGTTAAVKGGSATQYSKSETLTLPGGLAKIYPLVQVTLPNSDNALSATLKVDTANKYKESNEADNSCTFAASAAIVG